MAYVSLYLSIRSGDWDLRLASIKSMAPIFTAFEHNTYQRVISQHLVNVLHMPQSILTMFKQGVVVVSLTGREWHSVGIDGVHKMLINEECKATITRPTPDYINRIANYLPYRSKVLQNTKKELLPETVTTSPSLTSPYSKQRCYYKFKQNVRTQVQFIQSSRLFDLLSRSIQSLHQQNS